MMDDQLRALILTGTVNLKITDIDFYELGGDRMVKIEFSNKDEPKLYAQNAAKLISDNYIIEDKSFIINRDVLETLLFSIEQWKIIGRVGIDFFDFSAPVKKIMKQVYDLEDEDVIELHERLTRYKDGL